MKKRIYFNIDELSRDAVVAANLKKALRTFGVDLEYGTRVRSRFLCDTSPFDAVIFHNLDILEAFYKNPENLTCPALILPTEGVGGYCRDAERFAKTQLGMSYIREGDTRWAEKVAAFCLWGKQQLENMEQYAPHLLDHCFIVGHPRHDERCWKVPRVENSDSGKIRIGFITRFDPVNTFDGRSILANIYRMRQSKKYYGFSDRDEHLDIENLYFASISDIRILFDIIDRLDPKTHEAIVRVHPREDRRVYEQLVSKWGLPATVAPWEQPFMHFVQNVDYVVGPPSTSFYDCVVAEKTVVSINKIMRNRNEHVADSSDDNMDMLNHVSKPDSIDELMEIIQERREPNYLKNEAILEILKQEENFPECRNSIDALAKVCLKVLETTRTAPSISLLDRLKYRWLASRVDRPRPSNLEQSSSFHLSEERKAWIDGLAPI